MPWGIRTDGRSRRTRDVVAVVAGAGVAFWGFGRRRRTEVGRFCGLLFLLIVINCATPVPENVGGTSGTGGEQPSRRPTPLPPPQAPRADIWEDTCPVTHCCYIAMPLEDKTGETSPEDLEMRLHCY